MKMEKIRMGMFETNSSSTHSLTVVTVEDFEKWKKGELLFEQYIDFKLVPRTTREYTPEDYLEFLVNHTLNLDNGVVFKSRFYNNLNDVLESNVISVDDLDNYFGGDDVDSDLQTYWDWHNTNNDDTLKTYEKHFTTPGGEKLVAFGKYGYDG